MACPQLYGVVRAVPVALRLLGALYLTAASAYTVALVLSQHPALAERSGETSMYVRVQGAEATAALENYVLRPGLSFARREAMVLAHNIVAEIRSQVRVSHVATAPRTLRRLAENFPARTQLEVRPRARGLDTQLGARSDVSGLRPSEDEARNTALSNAVPGARGVGSSPQYGNPHSRVVQANPPRMQVAPPSTTAATPNLPQPTTTEIAQVEQRLKDSLSSELYDNFELFLYVSKAASGPLSQRMYVFEKEPTGDLALSYNWPVSTGRERVEYNADGRKLPSFTPQGYYELDPHRFFPRYWSSQWGEPMPYAMFFNWKKDGQDTGLAIHAASGDDIGLLGSRASAGCIRLPPDAARTLFNLVRTKYRGLAPQFAFDQDTGTMSNNGVLLHDADGHVQLAKGYKVLVFIEDYGGENVVAAMY